ncbi:MAG TPA: type II secretion system protein GspN [Geobacteraceae bacterium]
MKLPRPLKIAAVGGGGLLLFLALTILFIPAGTVQSVIQQLLAREGYSLQTASFGKALPLGIQAKGLVLSSDRGRLLTADELTVRLRLLPLLRGRLTAGVTVRTGGGVIAAELSSGGESTVRFGDISLETVPFFTTVAGAQLKGLLRGSGRLQGSGAKAKGNLQLEVVGADLRGIKIGETPLPDAGYRTVQGAMRIGGGKADLESLTLQGDSLFVRLKGDFPLTEPIGAAPLNLTLELMPKPEFLEQQKFIFLLLVKYLVSPGHYQIPIRGVLAKPSL